MDDSLRSGLRIRNERSYQCINSDICYLQAMATEESIAHFHGDRMDNLKAVTMAHLQKGLGAPSTYSHELLH